MKKLRLTEVMSENQDKNVKLGFENGSGFFYCGPVNECDLKAVDGKVKEWVEQASRNAISSLACTVDNLDKYVQEFNARVKNLSKPQINEYGKVINRYAKTAKNQFNRVIKLDKYVQSYVPISEREVTDVYDSILNKNEIIVIVDGIEVGPYWDDDEYGNRQIEW